jgi:hypothetical protein
MNPEKTTQELLLTRQDAQARLNKNRARIHSATMGLVNQLKREPVQQQTPAPPTRQGSHR